MTQPAETPSRRAVQRDPPAVNALVLQRYDESAYTAWPRDRKREWRQRVADELNRCAAQLGTDAEWDDRRVQHKLNNLGVRVSATTPARESSGAVAVAARSSHTLVLPAAATPTVSSRCTATANVSLTALQRHCAERVDEIDELADDDDNDSSNSDKRDSSADDRVRSSGSSGAWDLRELTAAISDEDNQLDDNSNDHTHRGSSTPPATPPTPPASFELRPSSPIPISPQRRSITPPTTPPRLTLPSLLAATAAPPPPPVLRSTSATSAPLAAYFRAAQCALLAHGALAPQAFHHNTLRGSAVERVVCDFVRANCANNTVHMGSGEVLPSHAASDDACAHARRRHQLDCVLYDARVPSLGAAALFAPSNATDSCARLFFAAAVVAVVEIKTTLTSGELAVALNAAAALEPLPYFVVALSSQLTLSALAERLVHDASSNVRGVFVLGEGSCLRSARVLRDDEHCTLAELYAQLFELVQARTAQAPCPLDVREFLFAAT